MQKGYKHTNEARKRMREAAFSRDNSPRLAALPKGEKHWNYSESPSKLALHKRLYRKHGKASAHLCFDGCSRQARDWSNETGNYTDDIKDYVPRCRKCHVKKDGNGQNGVKTWRNLTRNELGQFNPKD